MYDVSKHTPLGAQKTCSSNSSTPCRRKLQGVWTTTVEKADAGTLDWFLGSSVVPLLTKHQLSEHRLCSRIRQWRIRSSKSSTRHPWHTYFDVSGKLLNTQLAWECGTETLNSETKMLPVTEHIPDDTFVKSTQSSATTEHDTTNHILEDHSTECHLWVPHTAS